MYLICEPVTASNSSLCVNSKQLIEMRRLDIKFDLSLADLVLTRHPKSEATFAHRSEIRAFSVFSLYSLCGHPNRKLYCVLHFTQLSVCLFILYMILILE